MIEKVRLEISVANSEGDCRRVLWVGDQNRLMFQRLDDVDNIGLVPC